MGVTILYIVSQVIHFLVRSYQACLWLCPILPWHRYIVRSSSSSRWAGAGVGIRVLRQGVWSSSHTYRMHTVARGPRSASGHPNRWPESYSPFLSVVGLYHTEYVGLNRSHGRWSTDFRSLPALIKGGYLKWGLRPKAQVSSPCPTGVILLAV